MNTVSSSKDTCSWPHLKLTIFWLLGLLICLGMPVMDWEQGFRMRFFAIVSVFYFVRWIYAFLKAEQSKSYRVYGVFIITSGPLWLVYEIIHHILTRT